MFVAVIYKEHPEGSLDSHRDTGGWEAFLGETKEDALEKARVWRQYWQTQLGSDQKPRDYQILVGELTEEAKQVYELHDIEA